MMAQSHLSQHSPGTARQELPDSEIGSKKSSLALRRYFKISARFNANSDQQTTPKQPSKRRHSCEYDTPLPERRRRILEIFRTVRHPFSGRSTPMISENPVIESYTQTEPNTNVIQAQFEDPSLLESNIESLNSRCAQYEEQKAALLEELADAKLLVQTKDRDIQYLHQELQEMSEDCNKSSVGFKLRLQSSETECERLRNIISGKENEFTIARDQMKSLLIECAALKSKLAEAESAEPREIGIIQNGNDYNFKDIEAIVKVEIYNLRKILAMDSNECDLTVQHMSSMGSSGERLKKFTLSDLLTQLSFFVSLLLDNKNKLIENMTAKDFTLQQMQQASTEVEMQLREELSKEELQHQSEIMKLDDKVSSLHQKLTCKLKELFPVACQEVEAFTSNNNKMDTFYEDVNSVLNWIQADYVKLNSDKTTTLNLYDSQAQEILSLKKQLSDLSDANCRSVEVINELEGKIVVLNSDAKHREQEYEGLVDTGKQAQSDDDSLKTHFIGHEEAVRLLQSENAKLAEELSLRFTADDVNARCQQTAKDHADQLEKLKQKMKGMHRDEVAKQKTSFDHAYGELQQTCEQLKEQLKQSASIEEIVKLKAALAEEQRERLESDKRGYFLSKELQKTNSMFNGLQKQNDDLKAQSLEQTSVIQKLKIDKALNTKDLMVVRQELASADIRLYEKLRNSTVTSDRQSQDRTMWQNPEQELALVQLRLYERLQNSSVALDRQSQNSTFRRDSVVHLGTDNEDVDELNETFLACMESGRSVLSDALSVEDRLSELQYRNSLCLPHLKSSYPIEAMVQHPIKIKDEEMKNTPPAARTSYRKKRNHLDM